MPEPKPESFFVTGGTLRRDAPSYVTRRADTQLREALLRSEFCYVLTARQMGKSSLMVQTAGTLREQGIGVAVLDLTRSGTNLTSVQWYAALVARIGEEMRCEDELEDVWRAAAECSPLMRFTSVLRHLVKSQPDRRFVIFIDEIDIVRTLSFTTDEFFVALRELFTARAYEPELHRLTLCLLGVASPADLIQDTRITPFNIGTRIELTDFTPQEAASLAQGLQAVLPPSDAALLLTQVLHWTGGQPYMTQRLCLAAAEALRDGEQGNAHNATPSSYSLLVDTLCHDLFLTQAAQETDSHLMFVRNRLLKSEADIASLLDMYQQVRKGRKVRDGDTDPLCAILKLSGVVKAKNGLLGERNEIYKRVFNQEWVVQHLPHAEVLRQKRAYRLGLLRAATLGAVVVTIMAALSALALKRSREAEAARGWAMEQQQLATSRLSRSYVDAGLRLMEARNYGGALSPLVESMNLDQKDAARMESHRIRFESVLRYSPQLEQMWFTNSPVGAAAVSPNKQWMAAGSDNGEVHVWDTTTGRELPLTIRHDARINFLAFHPSGTILATCGNDNKVSLWDLQTLRLRETLSLNCPPDHPFNVASAAWSRNGKRLVVVGWSRLAVWDFAANPDGKTRLVTDATIKGAGLESAALSDDEQNVAFVAGNFAAKQKKIVGEGKETLGSEAAQTRCFNAHHIEYSPDGNHLLVAGIFGGSGSWRGAAIYTAIHDFAHKPPATWEHLLPHEDGGIFATYSPDGTRIVTASRDRFARVWNARNGKPLTLPLPHGGIVNHAAFSSDGKWIATASADGKVQVWNARTGDKAGSAMRHAGSVVWVAFGKDNSHLLTAGQDGTVRLWRLPDANANPLEQLSPYDGVMSSVETPSPVLVESRGKEAEGYHSLTRFSLIDTTSGKRTILDDGLTSHSNGTGFNIWEGRSEDGKRSVVVRNQLEANARRRVQVWDVARGVPLGAAREADTAMLSPSGKSVLYQQKEGTQWVEDTDSGKTLRVVCRPTDSPHRNALAFTPDEQSLVMADTLGNVWIEEIVSGVHRSPMMHHAAEVFSGFYLPDCKTLATLTTKGTLQMWNPESGTAVSVPDQTVYAPTFRPRPIFSPDKKAMLYPRLWRLDAPHPWHPIDVGKDNSPAGFNPDSTQFVVFKEGLRVFDARTGAPLTPRMDVGSSEVSMVFSADGKRLAAGFEDGTVRVFDAHTLQPISPLMDNSKPIVNIRFSPSGNQIVTAAHNGPMRFWDAATGEAVSPPLPLHGGCRERQFDWTPDGTQFFVSTDRELRRWTQPNLSRSLQEMQAYAYLSSGQRIDAKLGTVPIDTAQLHAAWETVQRGRGKEREKERQMTP